MNKTNKPKEGQLKVYHIPQIPMHAFEVFVDTVEQAWLLTETLASYDNFQFENKIKPDYSNSNGLLIYRDGDWEDFYDQETGLEYEEYCRAKFKELEIISPKPHRILSKRTIHDSGYIQRLNS